jgi:hypothetical protein
MLLCQKKCPSEKMIFRRETRETGKQILIAIMNIDVAVSRVVSLLKVERETGKQFSTEHSPESVGNPAGKYWITTLGRSLVRENWCCLRIGRSSSGDMPVLYVSMNRITFACSTESPPKMSLRPLREAPITDD